MNWLSRTQLLELVKELSLRIQLAVKYCEDGNYNKQDIIDILTGNINTEDEEIDY